MNELLQSLRNYDILTVITFLPCVGALILLFLPRSAEKRIFYWGAFLTSLSPLPLVLKILWLFNPSQPNQFDHKTKWIPSLGVDYFVGIDGLSIAMVLLVSIITPLTILGACKWIDSARVNEVGMKPFFALILLEQTGLYGAFTALNFFHWFIFWEVSLVPMFFLIKLYGHQDRTHAAYQFFIYTFVGSVAMLIGMQFIYLATGTWDFMELAAKGRTVLEGTTDTQLNHDIKTFAGSLGIPFLKEHAVTFIFLLVFFGFAVKVPLWPFHTWLPVTYTEAPTAGSMLLTGLMSKMGVYGFLRIILPIFGGPLSEYANILMLLALATILFGALAALVQQDLKRVIAYSSVSHLGYCLLGIFAVASSTSAESHASFNDRALVLNGVIVQMFAHGLSAAGLFYFIGLIEERTQTRQITDLGGLRKTVPVMCGLMGIILFASLGLPGLAGFVGEFMIFRGAFPLAMGITCVAAIGFLLTALYLLRVIGNVFFGPQEERWNSMPDLSFVEKVVSVVLVALLFGVGLVPASLINLSNSAVVLLVKTFS